MSTRGDRHGLTLDQRLARDTPGMSRWYPGLYLIRLPCRPPAWKGWIKPFRTRLKIYQAVVEYRPKPLSIPQVWVVEPEVSRRRFPHHPHLNSDGSVCAFFVPDKTYDPAVDEIVCFVDLVVDWLKRHVFWQERGWWPGPEAPHDPVGVLSEIREIRAVPCVCGSGVRFADCHGPIYLQGAAAQRADRLREKNSSAAMSQAVQHTLRELRRIHGARGLAKLLPHLGPPPIYLRH